MAAASLTDAMRELGQAWAAKGNPAPRFVFAASSALARQVEQGAPADVPRLLRVALGMLGPQQPAGAIPTGQAADR